MSTERDNECRSLGSGHLFWVHAGEGGGDAHADCPAISHILQLVSREASLKRTPLLARAVRSISKTGKEMDVQQGKSKRGGSPEGSLNA